MKRGPIAALAALLILATALSGCSVVTFLVTYAGNGNTGGTVPVDANEYAENKTVGVLGNTGVLVKDGFVFAGWNTDMDGTGTNIAPWSSFVMEAADVTLYAKWVPTLRTLMSGTWDLSYDWDPPGPDSDATWTLSFDGTFTSSGGGFGTWDVVDHWFIIRYSGSPNATYQGAIAAGLDSMAGEMRNTVPAHGTWTATRAAVSMAPHHNVGPDDSGL